MVNIMTIEKTRIPDPEVINANSAPSSSDTTSSNEVQFATKEEYIKHLVDQGSIKRSQEKFNDNLIHLQGHLLVDQSVAPGLNWNDVAIQGSAQIMSGQITQYQYLPLTTSGVATELKTKDTQEFIKHNYFNAKHQDNKFIIKSTLRIHNFNDMPDMKDIIADKVFLYNQKNKVNLEDLPTALNGFYGLSADKIATSGIKNVAKVAKTKGLSKKVCNELAPSFFSKIFGNAKSNKNQ